MGRGRGRHQAQLSRDDITAAVHYVRFEFSAPEVDAFAAGPVELAVDHQNYRYATRLRRATVDELLTDLRP